MPAYLRIMIGMRVGNHATSTLPQAWPCISNSCKCLTCQNLFDWASTLFAVQRATCPRAWSSSRRSADARRTSSRSEEDRSQHCSQILPVIENSLKHSQCMAPQCRCGPGIGLCTVQPATACREALRCTTIQIGRPQTPIDPNLGFSRMGRRLYRHPHSQDRLPVQLKRCSQTIQGSLRRRASSRMAQFVNLLTNKITLRNGDCCDLVHRRKCETFFGMGSMPKTIVELTN